jgi:predicted DNA-binding transcriptional regulator AlpA
MKRDIGADGQCPRNLAKPIVSIARLQMPAMTRTIKSFLKQSHSGLGESEAPSASSPPANTCSAPIHILRLAQVIERTGLKKTKIYEQFPMRVKITAHAVGWIEDEVQASLVGRIAKNNPLRTYGSRA